MYLTKKIKTYLQSNLLNISLILVLFNASLNFINPSSYVRGVLVDYLIFQLYLGQIFILILLILFYKKIFVYKKYLLYFVIFFILLILMSNNPHISSLYVLRRFIYIPFFLLLLTTSFKSISLKLVVLINIIYLSILVLQFLQNSNIFSYFPFGFYPFEGVDVRLDYLSWFGNKKVIPIGNFPHPNVFAAFFSFLNALYLAYFINKKSSKLIILITLNIFSIVILGSISALLFNFLALAFLCFKNKKFKYMSLLVGLTPLLYFIFAWMFKNVSFNQRIEQYKIGYYLLNNFVTFGVGIGNYIPSILKYENFVGRIYDLQPIHNIFFLYLVETGLFGFSQLLAFLVMSKKYLKLSIFLIYIIIFGIFDHFLLTLNQGLLMLTLTMLLHKSIINSDAK